MGASDIGRNGFALDALYGDVGTAKTSHLESLANRALETDSPNAYFLLGMTLHYSGEAARAVGCWRLTDQGEVTQVQHPLVDRRT